MSTAIDSNYLPSNRHIINHDIMHCTAKGVDGNHLYSGRALGLSEPWDLIQLHPYLKPLWEDINQHYKRIGLRHTQQVIWDVDMRELGSHIGYQPSVFYFGPNEFKFWGDDRWLETVEYINSKNNFMALAEELGVDVPKTQCFDSAGVISPKDIAAVVYPCYLKAAVSVSGVGIYRCVDEDELHKAIARFADGIPVQIQEEVKTDTFLNLQYQVIGDHLVRLAASEQILDGFAHQGNRVPASHEPWDTIEPMAEWLRDHGIKGIFAFDVAVVQTDKGLRFPAIECNPRFNGASYPTLVANKLGVREWSAITLHTRLQTLHAIDLEDLEFDPKTGKGIIIINWGTVLIGKLVVLLAGPREAQDALAVELRKRL